MGTSIDRVGGGGFGTTGRGRAGGNLMMDKGGDQAKMVLSGAKGTERDTD